MPSSVRQASSLEPLLDPPFDGKHVRAILKHFQAMTVDFQIGVWEGAIVNGGKFIEAVLKALYQHAGKVLPPPRQFKARQVINGLEQLPVGSFDDSIRLTIPRACDFAYDIASNRGARHDPAEVDPNEMDARIVLACGSGRSPKCCATRRRARWTLRPWRRPWTP